MGQPKLVMEVKELMRIIIPKSYSPFGVTSGSTIGRSTSGGPSSIRERLEKVRLGGGHPN